MHFTSLPGPACDSEWSDGQKMKSQAPADEPTIPDAERGEKSQDGFADSDEKRNPVKPNGETGHDDGDESSPRDNHPEPVNDELKNR